MSCHSLIFLFQFFLNGSVFYVYVKPRYSMCLSGKDCIRHLTRGCHEWSSILIFPRSIKNKIEFRETSTRNEIFLCSFYSGLKSQITEEVMKTWELMTMNEWIPKLSSSMVVYWNNNNSYYWLTKLLLFVSASQAWNIPYDDATWIQSLSLIRLHHV